MPLEGRSLWLRAEHAIESIAGAGAPSWSKPPEVRRAIMELGGVFPVTHLVIDLDAVRLGAGPDPTWKALLGRGPGWGELLGELVPAIASALRPPCAFGLALPDPRAVAAEIGDGSDRVTLKAGLLLASFLQGFRAAGLAFVALRLCPDGADVAKAAAPVLRNAGMYGWNRAIERSSLEEPTLADVDVRLVDDTTPDAVRAAWAAGEAVGGGIASGVWQGEEIAGNTPSSFLLYGATPPGLEVASIVAAGRALRKWMGQ